MYKGTCRAAALLEERSARRGRSAAGRTVRITVEEGRLFGQIDGRGSQPLVAISESEFTGLDGLGVQFAGGGLYVKHVSGNYRFERSK